MDHKIFMDPELKIHLPDYGIKVPLFDTRVDQVVLGFKKSERLFSLFKKAQIFSQQNIQLTFDDLLRVHTKSYLEKLLSGDVKQAVFESYEISAKNSSERFDESAAIRGMDHLVEQVIKAAGNVIESAEIALQNGFCYLLHSYAGAHHAMSFAGRGFCLINDIIVAIRFLQHRKTIKTAWILDIDAHKGDGSAECTYGDASISTLSIHMAEGWPLDILDKRLPHWIPSDIDIPVQMGDESNYLSLLTMGLNQLNEISSHPDLAIVIGGADPYEGDALPGTSFLKLSENQMLKRDLLVYNNLKNLEIPQLWLMAGGYGHHVYKVYENFLKSVLTGSTLNSLADKHSH